MVLLNPSRPHSFRILLFLATFALVALPACKRASITKHEYMYVSGVETSLRDRVATMYNKVGTVHNGDRVDVLEHQRRFMRVRTDQGVEGWIEERNLVSQEIYDGFQKLAQDAAGMPGQGHGTHARRTQHAHHPFARWRAPLSAEGRRKGRDTQARHHRQKRAEDPEAGTDAQADAKPSQTSRFAASLPSREAGATPTPTPTKTTDNEPRKRLKPPKPVMEDWYLVRNSDGHVGWVLMRMVDLDVPLDVAQYAEGQRIIGYFVLNTVPETIDGVQKEEPQYLMLLNQPTADCPTTTTRSACSPAIAPSIATKPPTANATWKATSR